MLEEIKIKYKNEIDEILDALKYCYYDELDQDDFEDDVICSFEEHYKKPFGWDNGATKGVLIFKNYGFVIKIPFNHCDGYELYGATDGDNEWDYCSQEKNRFKAVKENDLQKVFLETDYLASVDNYPIYIQLFAEPLDKIDVNSHSSHTKEDIDIINNIIDENYFGDINLSWEADMFALYGKKFYIKFKEFIHDYKIEDLRTANVGYVGLYPVILDYAGFND